MSGISKIEWTDATWSPVTGCTKESPGCKHCWAKHEVVTRWSHNPASIWFGREFEDVQCHEDKLDQPLHWRKPRRIFVCPRSDLFHEDVSDPFIDRVFAVMMLSPQHTYQVLTKRAKRMRDYLLAGGRAGGILYYARNSELGYWGGADRMPARSWPPKNVWLGVSTENRELYKTRVTYLAATAWPVRFVSFEPLLGDIGDLMLDGIFEGAYQWGIGGGESGPNARPSRLEWYRSLRDQHAAAGVAYFHKQNGEWIECETEVLSEPPGRVVYPLDGKSIELIDGRSYKTIEAHGTEFVRVGKRAAGRLLDGREHSEFPA